MIPIIYRSVCPEILIISGFCMSRDLNSRSKRAFASRDSIDYRAYQSVVAMHDATQPRAF
jgi:hypothetical protein